MILLAAISYKDKVFLLTRISDMTFGQIRKTFPQYTAAQLRCFLYRHGTHYKKRKRCVIDLEDKKNILINAKKHSYSEISSMFGNKYSEVVIKNFCYYHGIRKIKSKPKQSIIEENKSYKQNTSTADPVSKFRKKLGVV
ncbi:MAG: hypothetical protein BWY04_01042 [candidate division CPR1 bacterium ADurb.Bin160]|uniref:Uncharacterized protein n=1 Tax=candidate division CPR1 bacterium ADurb.Bin160 TaxID=1852826 RepID=A0A1V5ZLJ9_9BACT|nr:MAG: hypothetical protein BWY04_01042 [candidate division CPR1 bacterium ADurb.Bin160]